MTGWLVGLVFAGVYAGMALGRWPGLALDRTGVALIGAILLFVAGAVGPAGIVASIDFATLAILFSLMILSSLVAASGFFEWCAARIAGGAASPRMVLALVVAVSGALSSVLTNDVVVWAMAPVLARGLIGRGLDPRPYVIALACAANAGSAATVIGNPQNLLIGQAGQLGFWPFVAACGVPAAAALVLVYLAIARQWRIGATPVAAPAEVTALPLQARPLAKAALAVMALVAVFTLTADRAAWTLAIAGLLLLSRTLSTRRLLGMVDWHLLLLFACLFVVTGALAAGGGPARLLAALPEWLDPASSGALAALSLAGSNSIGNVPLVVLVLAALPDPGPDALYRLAVFSTLSGNFLIVGSMANIIAVERARDEGVAIGFVDYARTGIPLTLVSLAIAWGWFALT